MNRSSPFFFVLLICLLVGGQVMADGKLSTADFQVVVHSDNEMSSMSKRDLSRIFLKKKTRWPSSSKIAPLNLAKEIPTRATFLSTVHGMDEDSHRKYWVKLIFAGRGQPPEEVSSTDEMLKTVARVPTAIGYVPSDTTLPEGVKVLEITP